MHANDDDDLRYLEGKNMTIIFRLDQLTLNVERIMWELKCEGKTQPETIKQIDGELTADRVTISLGRYDSDNLLLHSTSVLVKTRSYSTLDVEPMRPSAKIILTVNDVVSLDLTSNYCGVLSSIWNTYKHSFGTESTGGTQSNRKIYFRLLNF